MQSEEVVGAALPGRPTSEVGANHSACLEKMKADQGFAAFWLVVRRGVRPSLARTVAEMAGLGGRPS
jgi:hypothetical protein